MECNIELREENINDGDVDYVFNMFFAKDVQRYNLEGIQRDVASIIVANGGSLQDQVQTASVLETSFNVPGASASDTDTFEKDFTAYAKKVNATVTDFYEL